jgi:hypothetical protein
MTGFDVAGGMFSHGSYLPAPSTIESVEDVAFVPPESEAMLEKV